MSIKWADLLNVTDVFLCPQAYITVSTDSARYNERLGQIRARPQTEWVPKPWPPKSKYTLLVP